MQNLSSPKVGMDCTSYKSDCDMQIDPVRSHYQKERISHLDCVSPQKKI